MGGLSNKYIAGFQEMRPKLCCKTHACKEAPLPTTVAQDIPVADLLRSHGHTCRGNNTEISTECSGMLVISVDFADNVAVYD